MSNADVRKIRVETQEQRELIVSFLRAYVAEYEQAKKYYNEIYKPAMCASTLRHGDAVLSFRDVRSAKDQHIEAVKIFITKVDTDELSLTEFESELNTLRDGMHEQHQFHLSDATKVILLVTAPLLLLAAVTILPVIMGLATITLSSALILASTFAGGGIACMAGALYKTLPDYPCQLEKEIIAAKTNDISMSAG